RWPAASSTSTRVATFWPVTENTSRVALPARERAKLRRVVCVKGLGRAHSRPLLAGAGGAGGTSTRLGAQAQRPIPTASISFHPGTAGESRSIRTASTRYGGSENTTSNLREAGGAG